ncbi:hypothetical protein G7Y89_g10502 [Cudoniella acicularis]|uniref:NADP-dependent oxidoreductase domain-containing protein n=1 Tax=Cudoniella acicularis TaxID=354080 RepID=A0A8H4VYZ5_9HELO|nr:hypothetical protein G7Y89_g10502 [Cudoniella acicularis]
MPTKPTPLRKLGKDGPLVPALGQGLMGLSVAYGTIPNDEERFKLLDRAVEIGSTFWDSADLYGDSEALIGKWFERTGKRSEIFLASKFGYVGKVSKEKMEFDIISTGEYCKQACEKSLKQLGTDYIDLCEFFYLDHLFLFSGFL